MPTLFDPVTIGAFESANRIVMAPLTRMRSSQPGDVPNDLMREYYTQRASAGLIVSEATQISPEGKGYAGAPGIYSEEQLAGWRRITDAVHHQGGRMVAQLWHVGRVSHESFHDGELPVSASAVPFRCRTSLRDENGEVVRVDCPTPRALETHELPRLTEDFAHATRQARAAGFDGVEVHGAHGYLLHQFMNADSNRRTDGYGGSLENRARLALEVIDAVVGAWSADRVGVRISPNGTFNGLDDTAGAEMGLHLAAEFSQRGLAFLHLSEPDWAGGPVLDLDFRKRLRDAYDGVIIAAGSYTPQKAAPLLEQGLIDAAAFGRPFIANPDLPERFRTGAELAEVDQATVYASGAKGYTDYPSR